MTMTELIKSMPSEEQEKAQEKPMPDWMGPMLAKLTHNPFSGEDWIFEHKLDGERLLAYVDPEGDVRLMTRNQKTANTSYPEIETTLDEQAAGGCILDGEVVAFNEDGLSDFEKLQPRMHVSSREEARQSSVQVVYYVFDCLYADGRDLTSCKLTARKKVLKAAVNWQDPLRHLSYWHGDGLTHYKEACEKGWEGLIAKQADSPYIHARSKKWLKFKCVRQQEFVIGGFTEPHGERVGFGALLLGFYRQGDLVYAGKVGTGFDDQTLKDLHGRLERMVRKTSPYDQGDPDTRDVHFVTPDLVCEVGFSEWTDHDKLRHPRYKGLRRDKDAGDVHKEAESQQAEMEEAA